MNPIYRTVLIDEIVRVRSQLLDSEVQQLPSYQMHNSHLIPIHKIFDTNTGSS